MLKLFSARTIILILAFVVLSTSAAISWLVDITGNANQGFIAHSRIVGLFVFAFFLALTQSTVWRWIWSWPLIGKLLDSMLVPDLTGFWMFTVHSNHPIIAALQEDGKTPAITPEMSKHVFIGRLKQGWLHSDFEVFGHDGSILDTSDTLLMEFSRESKKQKPKIYWFYEQSNKHIQSGDTESFQGASVLQIRHSKLIRGLTWSNRNWESGGNTAGRIQLDKLEATPLSGMSDEELSERAQALYKSLQS